MLKKIISAIVIFSSIHVSAIHAAEKKYTCGLSNGYPPYQFKNEKEETVGFDADVLRLVFQNLEKEINFKQMNWDDAVGSLKFTTKLDCVGGMEITDIRKDFFNFTSPYYSRQIVVFTLANNDTINNMEDLIGKKVTGDRHSSLEMLLEKKGIRKKIRIKETTSKEESMRLLITKEFSAMIAPKAVGLHLAKQFNVEVKILPEIVEESPVAIVVKKGNFPLLNMIDNSLHELIQNGEIQKLYQIWFK